MPIIVRTVQSIVPSPFVHRYKCVTSAFGDGPSGVVMLHQRELATIRFFYVVRKLYVLGGMSRTVLGECIASLSACIAYAVGAMIEVLQRCDAGDVWPQSLGACMASTVQPQDKVAAEM